MLTLSLWGRCVEGEMERGLGGVTWVAIGIYALYCIMLQEFVGKQGDFNVPLGTVLYWICWMVWLGRGEARRRKKIRYVLFLR